MRIFKIILITLFSILGAAGIIILGVYLSGGFDQELIYPQNIFFANVSTVDGEEVYTERGATPYNKYEGFQLTISTRTEEFNQRNVTLSFPTNQTGSVVRYLQKVELDDTFANDSVSIYYAYDSEGKILKFASSGQSQATYVTNGVIIVPINVRLNRSFDVHICLAPDNLNEKIEIAEDGKSVLTKLYNIGGYSQLIARSSNLNIASTSAYINIDVPVENIEIIGMTGENISETNILGLNEFLLTSPGKDGFYDVGTEGLFSVALDITPARAVYKYGKNGDVGDYQYKTVVFTINSDEGLIAFADKDNNELTGTLAVGGVKYIYNAGVNLQDFFEKEFKSVFDESFALSDYDITVNNWSAEFGSVINNIKLENGILHINIKNNKVNEYFEIDITATSKSDSSKTITKTLYGHDNSLKYGEGAKTTTLGAKFVAKDKSGQSQVHVGIFKNALLEDEAITIAGVSNYEALHVLMNNEEYGLVKTSIFDVKEIAIDGFEVTDKFNQGLGVELDLTINNKTTIYASNPDAKHSLGINMFSNMSAQNRIRNILLSIQFSVYDEDSKTYSWHDATQINGGVGVPALFNFYSGNEVVTGEALNISNEASEGEKAMKNWLFYRPSSYSNMSYWEVVATNAAEKLSEFGINSIRIYVYYLNPESGLVLNDNKYGPYDIYTVVNEPVETELDWSAIEGREETLTDKEIGAGKYNERVMLSDKEDKILLENLALIKNLSSNPTYKTIRYFIYSEIKDLDEILNVEKYSGDIPGVSGEKISVYEVKSSDTHLICYDLKNYEEITFNLTFAVVEHLPSGSPVVYDDEIYGIVTLPTDENNYIIYAPIKIQKTVDITDIKYDGEKIKPYSGSDQDYFLQNREGNLEFSFTVNDANLFEALASKGDIVLSAKYIKDLTNFDDIYLSYEDNGEAESIQLENVLSTIFAKDNDGSYIYEDVLTIEENDDSTTTYKIVLSINQIPFAQGENEKEVRLDLTYLLHGANIPSDYENPMVKSTENFYIYSGKISEAHFGNKEKQITAGYDGVIYIDKTVKDGKFEVSIYIYETEADKESGEKAVIDTLFDNDGYMSVYIKEFGIDDSYEILSNNHQEVAQITPHSENGSFAVNFVKEGTVTLTLAPSYAHSEYQPEKLTFVVKSEFYLEAKYGDEINEGKDERVIDYGSLVYEIVGVNDDAEISFASLIQVLAKVKDNGDSAEVTDKFVFNVDYEEKLIYTTNEYPDRKIEIIYNEEGLITGIKIKNDLGKKTTLVVTALSSELSATYIFNLNIIPYEQIVAEIEDHSSDGANKPVNAESDSNAVYAEAEIDIKNFNYQVYNLENKQYESSEVISLTYVIYDKDGKEELGSSTLLSAGYSGSVTIYDNETIELAYLTFENSKLTKIRFSDVSELTKYIVTIKNNNKNDTFDLAKNFIFYVSPNIKVDTESFKNEEEIDASGIINLNNKSNPILNGEEIKFEINGSEIKLTFKSEIEIAFIRIFENNNFGFNEDFAGLKIGESSSATYIVSDAKKLSEQSIIFSYRGKEFTIKYWTAPNITLTDDEKTVVYDKEEYIALYAGQDISTLYEWFNNDIENNVEIRYGTLRSQSELKILSLQGLYNQDGKINLTEDGRAYTVRKNDQGLIEATIIVSSGEGANREFVTFRVLIFPFKWEFINYSKTPGADAKNILSGECVKKVPSNGRHEINGENEFINIENFKALIDSKQITYKLYLSTPNGYVQTANSASDSVRIAVDQGELKLIAQPLGEDREYRLDFTYATTGEEYTFSYYVELAATQKININYPYGEIEEKVEEFENEGYQNIFYTQFTDDTYIIDLNSSLRNFTGSSFVELIITNDEASPSPIEQNASTSGFNRLSYSIHKVINFTLGTVVTGDASNYITLTPDGIVTLKIDNQRLGFVIKVETPNGATAYYQIITEQNSEDIGVILEGDGSFTPSDGIALKENELFTEEEDKEVEVDGNAYTISKSFGLSKLKLTNVSNDIKFALIDETGKVLNASNSMMFIYDKNKAEEESEDLSEDLYVVTRTAANTQKATLVIYTTDNGIICEIEMVTESQFTITTDYRDSTIYGDAEIDLFEYLKINEENIITDDNWKYVLIFNNFNDYITQEAITVDNIELIDKTYSSHQVLSGDSSKLTLNSGDGTFTATAAGEFLIRVIYSDDTDDTIEYYILTSQYNSAGGYDITYNKLNQDEKFTIKPLNSQKEFSITVYMWSATLGLDGKIDETTCIETITLTVKPKIEVKDYVEQDSKTANNEEGIDLDFDKILTVITEGAGGFTDYKVDVSVSRSGFGDDEKISLSEITNGEIKLIDTFDLSNLINGTTDIKIYIGPIAAKRTIIVTVVIYKGEVLAGKIGDSFTATYTLTVEPDTSVEINYPNHDTGETFDTEYIYWKDYYETEEDNSSKSLDLTKRLTFTGTTANTQITYEIQSGYENWIEEDSENSGKFKIKDLTDKITNNTAITITIKIDGIVRGAYKLTITNEPVFTARYQDNSVEKEEQIADTQIPSKEEGGLNVFDLDSGSLQLATNGSKFDLPFGVAFRATLKTNSSIILTENIYGIGGTNAQLAKLFVLKDEYKVNNDSQPTIESGDTYDILGRIDDDEIVELGDNGSLKFLKSEASPYALKITRNSGSKYYYVKVAASGDGFTPTYYESVYDKKESELEDHDIKRYQVAIDSIFDDSIDYDLYDYSVVYETGDGIVDISATRIVQPKALLNFYYNGNKIPYDTAKTLFKYEQTESVDSGEIGDFKISAEVEYDEETTLRITNQHGTEVAAYKYTVVYDYKFDSDAFDEVEKTSDNYTSSQNNSYYYIKSVPNINISGLIISLINITKVNTEDNDSTTELKYVDNQFVATGAGTFEVEVTYNDGSKKEYTVEVGHEFENYNPTTEGGDPKSYLISKLITLKAGQTYDLIDDILVEELGLKALSGGGFDKVNFKVDSSLVGGKFNSNANYINTMAGLISFSEVGISDDSALMDYKITPYGAKNDGDIVHFEMKFGGKTYYLRIKIEPSVRIVAENNGSLTERFEAGENEEYIMDYNLTNIIKTLTNITPEGLILSVIAEDSDNKFVIGATKTNVLKGMGTQISGYSVELYETKLGGAKIRFILSDKFGYVATNDEGAPITITLSYQNSEGQSPNFIADDSVSHLYEGDEFTLAYRYINNDGETKYGMYSHNEKKWTPGKSENDLASFKNIIMLNDLSVGFPGDRSLTNLSASLSVTQASLNDLNGLLGDDNTFETNRIPNTRYGKSARISGDTLLLTLKINRTHGENQITETARIPIPIEIRQRYQLRYTDHYSTLPNITDPHGESVDVYLANGMKYSLSDLFVVWDLKEGETVSGALNGATFPDNGGSASYLSIDTLGEIEVNYPNNGTKNYVNRIAIGGTQTLTLSLTIESGFEIDGYEFDINYNITPKYYSINSSGVQTYLDYGVVVISSSTNVKIDEWQKGFTLTDIYGVPYETKVLKDADLTFEKESGTGTVESENSSGSNPENFGGYITGMAAAGSIIIKINCESQLIGTVKITLAKYYGLTGDNSSVFEEDGVLPFNHPDSDNGGWGEGIKGLVVPEDGEEAAGEEQIDGGRGHFEYKVISGQGKIAYSPIYNCWVIEDFGSATEIDIEVKYMGKVIGAIVLTETSGSWESESHYNRKGLIYTLENGSYSVRGYNDTITSLDIPDNYNSKPVKFIRKNSFYGYSNLTTITIPDGVTSIGDYAFYNCSSLTEIEIPDGVTEIGIHAFDGCSNLTSIEVSGENAKYSSSDGVLFKGQTTLIRYPEGKVGTSYAVPDDVTSIEDYAFYNCSNLTSITIPDGVTSIGDYAFYNCSSLTEIEIPDGVTSIGSHAFGACSSLTSITIPDGVTEIGNHAFDGCSNLTSINVSGGNENYSSSEGVLFKGQTTLIRYPEGKVGTSYTVLGVTSIEDYAFYNCSSLTEIEIPDGVSIGKSAFNGCTNLTEVVFKDSFEDLLNEELWESGTITSNKDSGSFYSEIKDKSNSRIRTKALIPIKSSREILINIEEGYKVCLAFFDEDEKYLGKTEGFENWASEIKFEKDAHYIAIVVKKTDESKEIKVDDIMATGISISLTPLPLGTNAFTGSGIAAGSGKIYVPSQSVDIYKTEWADFKEKIFPIVE